MILSDYIDIVRFELDDNDLPAEYLRRQINYARREIAKLTRALECDSTRNSVSGTSDYQIPRSSNDTTYVDCAEVLDVLYDSLPLYWINNREMTYKHAYSASGTPIWWSYYGGEAQPTGFIRLDPIPNAIKVIKIHAVQFPLPLINREDTCELNDIIQQLVTNYVEGLILTKRGHPEGAALLSLVNKGIRENIRLRTL